MQPSPDDGRNAGFTMKGMKRFKGNDKQMPFSKQRIALPGAQRGNNNT